MKKLMGFNKYDEKLISLYKQIKWESKWLSLNLSEKLELLAKLDKTLKLYKKMNREKELNMLTPEMVMDHLSERGFRRTRRLLEFCEAVETQYYETFASKEDLRREVNLNETLGRRK